jgi:tetratricopeptide (TPR) repeat protein
LLLIRKLEGTREYVSDLVIAKIYLNLGIIAQTQGDLGSSLLYHRRALEYKLKELPETHADIMSQFVMIAFCLQKSEDFGAACQAFEKALQICKDLYGDSSENVAYSMCQLADAYSHCEQYDAAAVNLEKACSVMSVLELKAKNDRITLQLNKAYLQLISLYLVVQRQEDAQQLTSKLEARLETALEDPFTFKLFNELGNTIRKHDNIGVAIQLYKKSLLSIKSKCKNAYLWNRDTSKVLINIASSEFMQDNLQEALRYYEHALNVVRNCSELCTPDDIEYRTLLSDQAKIHVSIAQILRGNQDNSKAVQNFKKALVSSKLTNY